MKKPIRKAVLPVAGLGTRFLPATKAVPKEMLTVVDRPILQYIVDEAREAGVEHFIFVTGRNKGVIEDHFDSSYELEDTLKRRGKDGAYAALMADLPPAGATSFTRQQAPLGLGHAVWCARDIVGDEPFAVLLPDMVTKPGARGGRCLMQCVEAYNEVGGNILALEEVPPDETHQYGVVAVGAEHGSAFEITGMVEKPKPGTAPSNLIISGRYILQPEIFQILELVDKGRGRRSPADRRHDPARPDAEVPRRDIRRRDLRLRIEARVPRGQSRLCAEPPGARRRPQGGVAQARLRPPIGLRRCGQLSSWQRATSLARHAQQPPFMARSCSDNP